MSIVVKRGRLFTRATVGRIMAYRERALTINRRMQEHNGLVAHEHWDWVCELEAWAILQRNVKRDMANVNKGAQRAGEVTAR